MSPLQQLRIMSNQIEVALKNQGFNHRTPDMSTAFDNMLNMKFSELLTYASLNLDHATLVELVKHMNKKIKDTRFHLNPAMYSYNKPSSSYAQSNHSSGGYASNDRCTGGGYPRNDRC